MKLAFVALLLILLASAAFAGEGEPVPYPSGSEMVSGILSTPQGYGRPATDDARLQKINADILEIFGGQDKGITPSDVNKFESQMKALGKSWDIRIFPHAGHAFQNSNNKLPYPADDTAEAWKLTTAFLEKYLNE